MNPLSRFHRFVFSAVIFLIHAFRAQAVTVVQGPLGATVQREAGTFSAAVVDGHPAVAWVSGSTGAVNYRRAADADGNSWDPPVVVESGTQFKNMSLRIADGHPAVCYFDALVQRIKFTRALDAAGSAWAPPVLVNGGTPVTHLSMEIIDGKPAVLFAGGSGYLYYIAATNASGSAWGVSRPVNSPNGAITWAGMTPVMGLPAVAFSVSGGLYYQRAFTVDGNGWSARVRIGSTSNASLQIVAGRPAVALLSQTGFRLWYSRAQDEFGSTWDAPADLDTITGGVSGSMSMAVLNGVPAIAYQAAASVGELRYVSSTDSTGTAWLPPVTAAGAGMPGHSVSLLEVNGRPGLFHFNDTRNALEFLRAVNTAAGSSAAWPAEPQVEQPPGTELLSDTAADFGVVPLNAEKSLDFALNNVNSGAAQILIQSAALTGANAAEFSVVGPLENVAVGAATAVPFTVTCHSAGTGTKTADLRLTLLSGGVTTTLDIQLKAATLPDIALEQPPGSQQNDGTEITISPAAPGHPRDLPFVLRNPGGAELNGLTLTIDGPDAADFYLLAPLPASVPPGGSAAFTLRHAPALTGKKSAAFHITSNVSGDKNPYDVNIVVRPGLIDSSFTFGRTITPQCLALQADGRILAGENGFIGRFESGGSVDASFTPPEVRGNVTCVAVQKDGRILIAGNFSIGPVSGRTWQGIARLQANGALDESFSNIRAGSVNCLAIQRDGGILLGGERSPDLPLPVIRPYLTRLFPDGSPDLAFGFVDANGTVSCLALQADDAILVGGNFTEIAGTPVGRIARLFPDGTPDLLLFSGFDGEVTALAVQPDGNIIAGGQGFSAGPLSGGLARLLPDGTRDASFTALPAYKFNVSEIALTADGNCLVAAEVRPVGIGVPEFRLVRFSPDGQMDMTFGVVTNSAIRSLVLQSDGKALAGGNFSTVNYTNPLWYLIRVDNDFASTRLKRSGDSTVEWRRGGSSPEVRDVSFSIMPAGSTEWLPLGRGMRTEFGWELSGLTLPASGDLRAQACAGGSVMESVTSVLTPLESWRLQYFNTNDNTGPAADNADPDRDGLTNFTEFAFGLDPTDRAGNTLPQFTFANGFLSATFTAPAGREDVLYGAEWSPAMISGSWAAIPDTGTAPVYRFRVPANGERVFARFTVRMR